MDSNRIRYYHIIGDGNAAGVAWVHEHGYSIFVDKFAFDKRFLAATPGANLRTVIAHEIGHLKEWKPFWQLTEEFSKEFWADYHGSFVQGLKPVERDVLLRRGFDRFKDY